MAGVTRTSCGMTDPRVSEFFQEYDFDRDENITLDDFLRFYQKNANLANRNDVVWSNLSNMRYRKDLKKYDEPIEPPQN